MCKARKFAAIFLTLVMCMTLTSPVYAAEEKALSCDEQINTILNSMD